MLQYKYNPQNAPFDELKKTFTARKELLSVIIDEITELRKSKSNQHYLIIGPRGIGKTNLLQMIYMNIKEENKLSDSFIPLQFAEEEYSIGNLRDFFEKIIEVLFEETCSNTVEKFLKQNQIESNDNVAAEHALDFLKNQSQEKKKKFIVFVDNLDLILDEQFKDKVQSKKLRDVLMHESFLVLISAAPTYFDEVSKYDKPLYNFFKIINLDELDEPEVEELIKKRSEFDNNNELIKKLDKYRPRIKALKHLTGGNPRLILMIYQILTLSEFSEVKNYLNKLLDDLTPYYQYKLKMLAPQQRKIVEAMAKLNKAVSPTDISKTTRLEVNKVSSNIKRLVDDGYVKLSKQERRKSTLYIISERLFRIWYQMRHSRSMKRKIEMFVEFIQIWYSKEDLEKESRKLSDKFYKCLSTKETVKAKNIIEHIDYIAAVNPDREKKYEIEDNVIQMMIDMDDLGNAEKKILERKQVLEKQENKAELARVYYGLGIVNFKKGNLVESMLYYDKAIGLNPDNQATWINRGISLTELGRIEDAIQSYDEAIKINPDSVEGWFNRGNTLAKLNNYEEAVKSYDKALKNRSDAYEVWFNRGIALSNLEKYDEALKSYNEAIKINPDYFKSWFNRGNALMELYELDDALMNYKKALELKPHDLETWYKIGIVYANSEEYQKALSTFKEGIEFAKDDEEKKLFYFQIMQSNMSISANEVLDENRGNAIKTFKQGLDYLGKAKSSLLSDFIKNVLILYFEMTISQENADLIKGLLEEILKRGFEEYYEFLEPYRIVVEYWLKDKDKELVLDSLNPEVREIVEKIIKREENEKH